MKRDALRRWWAQLSLRLRQRFKGSRKRLRVRLFEDREQPVPTLVFLNVHRGASSFVSGWLAPGITASTPRAKHLQYHRELARGRTPRELALPPHELVVSRVYPMQYEQLVEEPEPEAGRFAGKKMVLLRRDPRDVAVSLYYAIGFSHRTPQDPSVRQRFLDRRDRLLEMNPQDAMLRFTVPAAIRQFKLCADFLRQYPDTLELHYEQLVSDFPAWMRSLGAYAGWREPGTLELTERLAPELEPPKKENPYSHKRRVTSGGWSEQFDKRHRRLFDRLAGAEMEEAGYSW